MSKETYVGGDIIEWTGGKNLSYAKEGIINSSNRQIIQKGENGGVIYGTNGEAPPISTNVVLKKFLVHFRRNISYKGEFGFDWMRDEYIYPITSVNGTNKELSLDIPKLKTEYKTTDVLNAISPYGKDYYSSFLNLMLNQEATLDIEVEELEVLSSDATEIVFESSNTDLVITPTSIPLSTLIAGGKKSKNLGGTTTKEYYLAANQVKVKCSKAFTKNEQIKIFAKLKDATTGIEDKKEVGKMMVMKNSDQSKYTINVYVIKAFISDNPLYSEPVIDTKFSKVGLTALEKYLNENSLNQGLIQVKLIDKDGAGNILKMPLSTNSFNSAHRGVNPNGSGNNDDYKELQGIFTNQTAFEVDSGKSVNFFNLQFKKLYGDIASKKSILLYLCPLDTKDAGGSSYTYPLNNKHCIIFGTNLDDPQSYAHEIGHTLGLEHIFLDKDTSCNPISLATERNKINQETNDFKRKIEEAKRKVDADWLKYKQENNAYFTQYPSKIAEYKKPFEDNKVRLDKQFSDYEKQQNDRLSIINKNELRFIKATTDNIMDYSYETDCAIPRPNILYWDTNQLIAFYKNQWKVIQDEAQKYYH